VQVIDTVAEWRKALDAERSGGRTVGLVPTMGALHEGHAALVDRAAAECDVVGVTVFVNPLQFGEGEDLASYPRSLEADVELAASHGATYVFAPPAAEMYPGGRIETVVRVPELAARWDGQSRPGHFDGVATVVTKLFAQAGPGRAYFGEKDYQQLCIVRRLAADLDLPIEVVGCPTMREADGLALSSRNAYLTPGERAIAPRLFTALARGADVLAAGGEPAEARLAMIAAADGLDVIYAEPVDPRSLEPLETALAPGGCARLLIAARLGRTRLIDNLGVTR